jgi:predicted type IV restriction endonuclease
VSVVPYEVAVAYYLFNFTRKNAKKGLPLAQQAAELLNAKLWGIGNKTANRDLLASGDQVLVYVGAPERAFVGHARLGSNLHIWTPEEAGRYPEDWPDGVSLAETTIWEHPIALEAVWSQLPSAKTNPGAQFFGGVLRITEADFAGVLKEREGEGAKVATLTATPGQSDSGLHGSLADDLFAATENLGKFLAQGHETPPSEEATRALFINRYLEALGYKEFEDIDYGVPVVSGDFADYVLRVNGQRVICVEAKKLGSALGSQQAAQVVKYASVLGLRWAVVTDGRHLKLYDPRVPHVEPADRLVFELDLAGYKDREDFELRIYPNLALLSKGQMADGTGLERKAAEEAVRELLTSGDSSAVEALRDQLKEKKLIHMSTAELADIMGDILG